MRVLDLFCGRRLGWSRVFAERDWECIGVDLAEPSEIPKGCEFHQADVLSCVVGRYIHHRLTIGSTLIRKDIDFIVASPPCEEFSVHGLKMWHKNPPYPDMGIKLFNHTRQLCEAAGLPYVIENVRSAQQFVGDAVSHCGPFYLWGNAVPPLLNQGITKGSMIWSPRYRNMKKSQRKIEVATIPPELANCVAEYAERICEASVK